ncbi:MULTISPECIES: DeoR/GlpR family DNA-binding transcription regulator [Enterococcus]|jgi:DeoR family fructose operon transcriptional repressor|uniref:DeoR/GlpR family DNA-binding transcription regulator n=2 Tax=Enterococcus TaxID=1350 RepID=A0ABD5FPG5_ENTCA|nr:MULTISPECIES: DeoR/GlpR family DNA-binding transcription regulator [Enterococcus]AMG51434.1 DeoR/GlpR transcriptional regulator [Enterococcus gallinarum]EEV29457.1 transcriptional regulator [Enterococcus casseliflavus EC30]EEV36000.1 transcriptional regulator [Enterococcus casseliflavus EC10]HAB95616.1 DeoR/GlpR transcriptional regulator [Enterococcus sp.]AUJ87300.1 DeoR/GlpR transcriptional regulator [Enterococcus sp. CR-Ec1]
MEVAMIPYERQEKILEALAQDELLKIEQLQSILPTVSISTLRRDLKELEKSGRVELLAGGAVKICSTASEMPIAAKAALYSQEKEAIATLAAELVHDGDVIYLDSGSTCTALLHKIINKKITIITTNTSVFTIQQETPAEILLLGGRYNPVISSLNGPLTDANLQTFNFQTAFLGANGIDAEKGVSTPNLVEANKKREILNNAKTAYLLCDSSKYGQVAAVKAFSTEDVVIISDAYNDKIGELTQIIYPN